MIYPIISIALSFVIGYIIGGISGVNKGYVASILNAIDSLDITLTVTERLTHEEKAEVKQALFEAGTAAFKAREEENAE